MRQSSVLLLATGLSLSACNDGGAPSTPSGPSTGTLVVSTSTTGDDPDQDGYLLKVDDSDSLSLDPTGTVQVDLAPGRHNLSLLGVAGHCSVAQGTSLQVDVALRDTTAVAFGITCSVIAPRPASGARITVTTTGVDIDPDGYRVSVDGTDHGAIPSKGSLLARLDPGSRTIALSGLAPNCAVDGPDSHTVTIVEAEVVSIEFAVVCTATGGVIGVVVSGSGLGLYQALVDDSLSFPVRPREHSYLGVPVGNHLVSLTAPANCSVHTRQQSVTVAAGGLSPDTVEVTFSVTCLAAPARIAFVRRLQPGPDGTPGPPDIYVANTNGANASRLTSGENPAWSPDGWRIAFNRGGTIHVIDADGSNEMAIVQGWSPAWSPDGSRIVFNTGFNRDDGIFVMNADGSGLTRLIRRDFAHPGSGDWTGWPEWSPDGRRISFVLAPDYDSYEPWQIYAMNADGSDPRNLNVLRSFAETHSWSPDGSRIALGVNQGNFWTIASVNSSGADFRIHYREEPGGYAAHPDWSPDGRTLVFEKFKTTTGCERPSCPMRIFVVSTAGGTPRQLIPEVAQGPDYWDEQPAWSRASE